MRAAVPSGAHPALDLAAETARPLPAVWSAHWAGRPRSTVLVDANDPTGGLDGTALLEQTARAAAALGQAGVGPGDRVLWSCAPGLTSIVTLLGALRAGAVVVPVSPAFTASELEYLVRDAAPTAAIVESAEQRRWIHDVAPGLQAQDPDDLMTSSPAAPPPPLDQAEPEEDALVVYTSGTTGQPKGAMHTHGSLASGVHAIRVAWGWEPDDRLLLSLPLFHVHGLCAGLFGTLTSGASAVIFDRFAEDRILTAAPSGSMFFGVPTMYHRLAATGRVGELSGLRLCVSGSAPLAADLWRALDAQGVPVLERYGMSETMLTLSNPLAGVRKAGTVGTPLPGVEAAIEQPDAMGVGELLVRGPSVCRGFWGKPEATAAAWVDGWFATGDLASVDDDGYVAIRGRRTELIITGGHNVYPAEVEAVLGRDPSVAEVAVVGVASPEWGESVEAFVVGGAGAPDLDALRARAEAELAPYKRPRQYHVVSTLPRNAMGKVIRRQLGA